MGISPFTLRSSSNVDNNKYHSGFLFLELLIMGFYNRLLLLFLKPDLSHLISLWELISQRAMSGQVSSHLIVSNSNTFNY